jgi:cell division septation protein DedD
MRNTLMRPVQRYILQPIRRAFGATLQPASGYYMRFTQGYLFQKTVVFVALGMMVMFGKLSVKEQPIVEADRPSRIYLAEEKAPPPSPERQDGYVLSRRETPIPFGTTYRTDRSSGVPRQDEITADYRHVEDESVYSSTPTLIPEKKPASVQAKSTTPSTKTVAAPKPANICERIKQAGGWYIQDNVFYTRENAVERAKLLRDKGINGEVLNTSCLGEDAWIVRLGYNQYTETAARTKAAEYAKLIEKAGLKTGKTLHKKI